MTPGCYLSWKNPVQLQGSNGLINQMQHRGWVLAQLLA
jgi:hypothetical protein